LLLGDNGGMKTPNTGRALHRRSFIGSLCRTAAIFSFDQLVSGREIGVEFVNVARQAGLKTSTVYGSEKRNKYLLETTGCGAAFFDYDNDGWLDIFLVNGSRFETKWTTATAPVSRLYKNNRDGTFTDVTLESGVARTGWGSGCCVGDFDNDGDLDILVSNNGQPPQLLRNDGGNANHWLEIFLIGTKSNRDAIGARVVLKAGKRLLVDEVRSGSSYNSSSDMRLHFGLGGAPSIDSLQVRWPSGLNEEFTNLKIDAMNVITEGKGRPIEVTTKTAKPQR